ncbi:MAG: phosphotransferase [Maritimibacter sp.]
MTEFVRLTDAFLDHTGWSSAQRDPLPGSSVVHSCERLRTGQDGAQVILVKAPGNADRITAFQQIARHLTSLGFSAPQIVAALPKNGLLIEEDFGEASFAALLAATPDLERRLYLTATDLLITLQKAPPPLAPILDAATMAASAGQGAAAYLREVMGQENALIEPIQTRLADALNTLPTRHSVLTLNRFHSENLFWLPERAEIARVGLIGLQNAALSYPAYDLISLIRDPYRDVTADTANAVLDHYAEATGEDRATLDLADAVLTAQQCLRNLGAAPEHAKRSGQAEFIDTIPRCWAHLQRALAHPALGDLAEAVTNTLPMPDPAALAALKENADQSKNPDAVRG